MGARSDMKWPWGCRPVEKVVLPKEHAECLRCLCEVIAKTYYKWRLYKCVYLPRASQQDRDSRIELLNSVAPGFFGVVQQVLISDLKMAICRLLDSKQSCRKGEDKNMVLWLLQDIADSADAPAISAKTSEILGSIKQSSSALLKQRNKLLAHADYKVYSDPDRGQLPKFGLGEMETILSRIFELINMFAKHFEAPWDSLDEIPEFPGDCKKIIDLLEGSPKGT